MARGGVDCVSSVPPCPVKLAASLPSLGPDACLFFRGFLLRFPTWRTKRRAVVYVVSREVWISGRVGWQDSFHAAAPPSSRSLRDAFSIMETE